MVTVSTTMVLGVEGNHSDRRADYLMIALLK